MTHKTALIIVRHLHNMTDYPFHLSNLLYIEKMWDRNGYSQFYRVVFRGPYTNSDTFELDGTPT